MSLRTVLTFSIGLSSYQPHSTTVMQSGTCVSYLFISLLGPARGTSMCTVHWGVGSHLLARDTSCHGRC